MPEKLQTRASIMMVVAHPADEDGGMLTHENRRQGASIRLASLFPVLGIPPRRVRESLHKFCIRVLID
jgi:hypothetical protein